MRRHVIIGHFGPGDRVSIPVAPDEVITWIDLVASYRRLAHGIGDAFTDLHVGCDLKDGINRAWFIAWERFAHQKHLMPFRQVWQPEVMRRVSKQRPIP